LDELDERLARLAPFVGRPRADFDADPYLRDIVERNLEIAAQCCINVGNRAISLLAAQQPRDYYEAILRLGVIDHDLALRLAPVSGLRSVLAHEYLGVDWDEVEKSLGDLGDLRRFGAQVRAWLVGQEGNLTTEAPHD
jgi:uncharacterized protein YutE (UPF0331/DUF86 family)